MKKIFVLMLSVFLVGCGSRVEIPPAHVGKILTQNGYAPETLPPSRFRLPACWAYCDKLILLQASDTPFKETLTIFMPDDKLNLTVEVRGTLTIPTDKRTVESLYSRLSAEEQTESISMISSSMVYQTYGQQALRGVVRGEIVKYTIAEILSQRESIGGNIHAALTDKLSETNTPLVVSRFELAGVQPPAVIVNAQEAAKEREIDIQKAEADAQVELVKAERELEIAKKNRLVEREKAEAIAEQNQIAADSITPQLLAYRRLEVAERVFSDLAKSDNVIIIPADSSGFSDFNDDAVLAKMLGRELKNK